MIAPDWASYDASAGIYERISAPHYFQEPAARLISLLGLVRGDVVLDVGAGTGVAAQAARRTAAIVLAIDPSLAMLLKAREAVPLLTAAAKLPSLPLPSDSFTCSTASFVLNHVADPVAALVEISRVLRPAGRVGATSWAVGPAENEAGRLWADTAKLFLDKAAIAEEVQKGLPGEERLADPKALAHVLSSAGFRVAALTQQEFWVRISTEDYLASRSIGMTARLMRSRLPDASWRRFHSEVAARMREQFGRQLEFQVRVNFAVGVRGEAV